MREYGVGFRSVRHVLLNAEVMDRQIEMQRGRHAHRRKIRCAMATGADMKESRKIGDLLQMSQTAAMHHGHPDVVDPLLANQLLRIPDGIQSLSRGDRSRRMLADNFEALL